MKRDRQKRFRFDHVFDDKVPTNIVYKKTVRRLIKSILEGYNGTVFAYGATGKILIFYINKKYILHRKKTTKIHIQNFHQQYK